MTRAAVTASEKERKGAAGALSARFSRSFPGFTLQPTKALWAFLAIAVLLGVAALNTGNNALYMLLSVVLGCFVASGVLSRHTLRCVRVELHASGEIFAGTPTLLDLVVTNRSRVMPACGVMCRLVGMPGRMLSGQVPPGSSRTVAMSTIFPRRGRRRLPAVQVEVRLPLPFFVKIVRWSQDDVVLVYPRRVHGAAARWAELARRDTVPLPRGRDRGGDVDQLREFHSGDDRRDIHWKQTARQQRLIVVERRERATPALYLVLDRQLPRRDDAVLAERFEALVSEVTTAALEQARRGLPVGLIVGAAVTRPAVGRGHLRGLLTQLALVQAVGPGDDPLPSMVRGEAVYRLAGGG